MPPLPWGGRLGVLRFVPFLIVVLFLTACGSAGGSSTPAAEVYRAPTQAVTPTPLPVTSPDAGEARPTAEPACTNALWFFQDVTIPDGTQVAPGERLDKRWLVQNAGTCNWDERYQVRLVAGPSMGIPPTQALYPARAGTEVTLRMTFIAPDEPGTYRSAWQAYDPDGQPFGDPFFIEIVVPETGTDAGG